MPIRELLGDRYRLVKTLRTTPVYHEVVAFDQRHNRHVQLWLFASALTNEAGLGERFLRALRALVDTPTPGAVRVLGGGVVTGTAFVRVQPGRAECLRTRLLTWRPSLDEVTAIVGSLSRTLSAAHDASFLHGLLTARDLLFVDGALRVGGIGLWSTLARRPLCAALWHEAHLLAPEVRRGDAASLAADLYGVAAVAAELLQVATGMTTAALRRRGWNPLLIEAIDRLLAAEPRERQPSLAALETALAVRVAAPNQARISSLVDVPVSAMAAAVLGAPARRAPSPSPSPAPRAPSPAPLGLAPRPSAGRGGPPPPAPPLGTPPVQPAARGLGVLARVPVAKASPIEAGRGERPSGRSSEPPRSGQLARGTRPPRRAVPASIDAPLVGEAPRSPSRAAPRPLPGLPPPLPPLPPLPPSPVLRPGARSNASALATARPTLGPPPPQPLPEPQAVVPARRGVTTPRGAGAQTGRAPAAAQAATPRPGLARVPSSPRPTSAPPRAEPVRRPSAPSRSNAQALTPVVIAGLDLADIGDVRDDATTSDFAVRRRRRLSR